MYLYIIKQASNMKQMIMVNGILGSSICVVDDAPGLEDVIKKVLEDRYKVTIVEMPSCEIGKYLYTKHLEIETNTEDKLHVKLSKVNYYPH